jgi:predicted nucleic acid-binding protein
MIVVDASPLLEVRLRSTLAVAAEGRLFAPGESRHAQNFLDVEVVQVLRRYCGAGAIDPKWAEQARTDLADLPVVRCPHHLFPNRTWELRNNLTASDAVYLALAEALQAPMLTSDAKLSAAVGRRTTAQLLGRRPWGV